MLPASCRFLICLGASASFACAIHCAVVPFASLILPLWGVGFLTDKRAEQIALAVSIALAGTSICWGIRIHGQRRLLALFGAALLFIGVGHGSMDGSVEVVMVAIGTTLFAYGHLINHRLCSACQKCSGEEHS